MRVSAFLLTALAITLFACQVPGSNGSHQDSNDPSNNPVTTPEENHYTGPVPAADSADVGYASSLADTETIAVTNSGTGAAASPLVLYSGYYSSTQADRIVKKSWSIPNDGSVVTILAKDIDHQNLWVVPSTGSLANYLLRLTDNGFLCLMKPLAGNQYNLQFVTSSSISWTLSGTTASTAWDWTLPPVTSDRELSSNHTEHFGAVVGPSIRLVNSPNWEVDGDGVHIVNKVTTYVDGTVRLKYNGSAKLNYVKITARVRNGDNSKRYFFYTYADADLVKSSGYESTSAVLSQGRVVRFKLIDNLVDVGMTFSDVTNMDIVVDASALSASYSTPGGISEGTPVWDSSSSGYIPIVNNNASPVSSYFGSVYFADSLSLEYVWDFPSLYQKNGSDQWVYATTPVPAGGEARLKFTLTGPNLGETFSLVGHYAEWEGRSLLIQGRPPTEADELRNRNSVRTLDRGIEAVAHPEGADAVHRSPETGGV